MLIFDTEVIDLTKPVYQKVMSGEFPLMPLKESNGIFSLYENKFSYNEEVWGNTGCTYPIFTSYCLNRAKLYFKDVVFFTNRALKDTHEL